MEKHLFTGAAILVCGVVRSASLNSGLPESGVGPTERGSDSEMPQESWEFFHFATRAGSVRDIWNTP